MQADDQPASESQEGPRQAKTYECSFCKKGFYNAQALGGHMNIHRREKARLKETMQPILDKQPCTTKIGKPLDQLPSMSMEMITYRDKSPKKRPWESESSSSSSSEEDCCSPSPRSTRTTHCREVKQLKLMVDEVASRSNKLESIMYEKAPKSSEAEEGLLASQEKLDLELRLGQKPSESSASITTPRKIF